MALISVSQAAGLILQEVPGIRTETVSLVRAAGKILAQPVVADRDYPPINRATMDGIAVKSGAATRWQIENTIAAGQPAKPLRDPASGCAKIMTGAEVPPNADTVIPFEDIVIEGDEAKLRADIQPARGQHIHAKSLDRKKGDLLLSPGTLLDAPRIAILAACGYANVCVAGPPSVSVISTGSEIVPVDRAEIQPHQSRTSNLIGLGAGLSELGIVAASMVHVADQQADIESAITTALASSDVLIITGGMSKGEYDFVPGILDENGAHKIFHGVTQKPGKPFWFGRTPTCCIFGLPGNPVSTLTVFRRYLVSFFQCAMGMQAVPPIPVSAGSGLKSHPSLTLFTPVKISRGPDGVAKASTVEYHGSGDLAALSASDGFVEISSGESVSTADRCFPFYSWR